MELSTANDVVTSESTPYSSQLDTIETSIHQSYPRTYQDYRLTGIEKEWETAIDLYAHTDIEKNTTRAENLLECRLYAWIHYNKKTYNVRTVSNACRLRWCPLCARARYSIIRNSVHSWLREVSSPKFLTLTVRNNRLVLSEQIQNLFDAFRRFRRHKGIMSRVRGGIWFLQVKRGKNSNEWHPHLHIALDSDYIPKRDLSLDWFISTGNSYIIDIRKIEDPEETADYVARYCSKPAKMSDFVKDDRYEMFEALHGKRLFGTFGSGKNCRCKPERQADYDDWVKICSWKTAVEGSFLDSNFQKLLKAYFKDEAVEQSVVDAATEEWLKVVPLTVNNAVIESKQLTLHALYERKPDG